MAQTLLNVIVVKNIVKQVVPMAIAARPSSPITTFSGTLQLQAETSFEAEDDRFDIAQLTSQANLGLISYEKTRRVVTTDSSTATG